MDVFFWDDGTLKSIDINFDDPTNFGVRGYSNLVFGRDGSLQPESKLHPAMPESEIRAKADALIAEAKRRFPHGGKTPVKDATPFPEKAFQKWLEKQG